MVAVTHLAQARSQKTRTGILGICCKGINNLYCNTKEKSSLMAAFFYKSVNILI